MSSSSNGLVAPIKGEHAIAANLNCFYCNNLQFVLNLKAPHRRKPLTAYRMQTRGNPDDYFVIVPTRYLLRDGWSPRNDQGLQDCRYCQFLHDTLNLFFVGPSMNWIKDSMYGWDGLIMAHVRKGFPLVLHCQEAIRRDCRWINLRAEIEVFCHDRSALSTCDFPSMYLALPEQEEIVDDRAFKSFMSLNAQNCRVAPNHMGGDYVIPNKLLHINWNAREIKLQHSPQGPPGAPGAPEMVSYATLSHCWSETDPKFPRLLKSNMRNWLAGIRIDDLPPAIHDAVEVAHRNNVHYLWIESLCVTQDDDMDVQVQRPYIGGYFRDSAVTIVAASSASPKDSFLFPLRKDWITKQIEFIAPSGGTATINLRRRYSRQLSPLDAIDESSHKSEHYSFRRTGPLYRQQRCYQEALLGTRVVTFTSAAIDVNCRRHNQCTGGGFTPGNQRMNVFGGLVCAYDDPALYKKRLAKRAETNPFDSMLYTGQRREDTAMWLQAVMQYTARDMTVSPKDKLSGIAGLASMTSMCRQKTQYLSGLWMSNLHEGLVWEVRLRPGQASATRITFPFKNQKAPSFSWASVDAGVHYPEPWNGYFVPDATIKATCALNDIQDPFNDVEGGYLKLRGRVMRCEVSQTLSGPTVGAKGKLSVAHFSMEEKEDGVKIVKTKHVPFVADGSLLMVKNRKWSREHSRKEAACSNCVCRMTEERKLVSEPISCAWRSVPYLTRNHCGFRKKEPKHGQKKISGTAYVLCLGWRTRMDLGLDFARHEHRSFEGLVVTPSLRYPGAYERIGCIRNIPAAAYKKCEQLTITMV
ncbi:hypothetical protein TGAM01_v208394 [Trichoderma gamsii]|uniref:Heterokaryon incompatibility domain-containing protein n=1 Tax=Trichoderma gamsii TaxID=398673 RepID=A0A2P4ZEJ9_9HYPO|nr:hypothetical protein TGAM01_v208394 [Trichoderma gamsii]PON22708.1 hypothetical protein TGAM01_v208394 [Trichoderma gamsii]